MRNLREALESYNKSIISGESMDFEKMMLHWSSLSYRYDILKRSYIMRARVREKLGDILGANSDKAIASNFPTYEREISPFQRYRRNYILY